MVTFWDKLPASQYDYGLRHCHTKPAIAFLNSMLRLFHKQTTASSPRRHHTSVQNLLSHVSSTTPYLCISLSVRGSLDFSWEMCCRSRISLQVSYYFADDFFLTIFLSILAMVASMLNEEVYKILNAKIILIILF